jgi:hypothetical protein
LEATTPPYSLQESAPFLLPEEPHFLPALEIRRISNRFAENNLSFAQNRNTARWAPEAKGDPKGKAEKMP